MAFWNRFELPRLRPFRKEEGFVALDVGSSSVKLVEAAAERNGYRLVNVGLSRLPAKAIQNNMVADREAVVKAIRTLIESSGVKSSRAICAVPGRVAIIKKIQLPAQGEEELEANVEFEASQVIPESLENVNLDYQVLDYLENGNKMEILLVAVRKEIIDSYAQAIRDAGLTPAIIDVDYFAMENMFEINYGVQPEGVIGLIHIGARFTSINVLKHGISTFTGDLPVGGEAFTEALIQALRVSYDEAEKFKVTGQLDGKRADDLETLLKPAADSLAVEVSRTLSLYKAMAEEGGINKIYLSGGSAPAPGLQRILSEKLGIATELADPFRGFSVSRYVDKKQLSESALALALGAGLSVRRPGDK